MKKYRLILIALLMSGIFTSSCNKNKDNDVVPDNVKVKLSDAISVPDLDKKDLMLFDTISGRDLYQELRTLIYIGDFASDLIEKALQSVKLFNIDKPKEFSYISDDDNTTKNVVVSGGATFEKVLWDYQLVLTDEQMQKGFELFWNMNPVKVVAILNPGIYNSKSLVMHNSMIRVDYSESDPDYDRTMLVRIVRKDSATRSFMKSMKMFLGQKGDVVDLYGNTIHPSAYIMDPNYVGGLSRSFKGRNNTKLDIAVAKCALPPVTLTNAGMNNLWSTYAMDTVLQTEMEAVYVDVNPAVLEPYLTNARGLAFFVGPAGFVGSGSPPSGQPGFTNSFIDLNGLNPWVPDDVYRMSISW